MNTGISFFTLRVSFFRSAISLRVCCLIIAGFFSIPAFAQDPHFSLFNSQPLYYNPASTGTDADVRVNLSYKNQWGVVTSPFHTYALNADVKFKQNHWKPVAGRTILETMQVLEFRWYVM
jgi:hypothetical protein